MRTKQIFQIISLVLFFIIPAYSQETGGIKGIVRDSATGEPIPYASIRILGTRLGVNTSVGGSYLLDDIPAGRQRISITSIGYKIGMKSVIIKKDTIQILSIFLAPEPVEMQTVTKISERIKNVYETNISAHSISQEEMKIVPIAIEKDLFRAMKIIPGIITSSDVTSQFFVRGGAGDQNLILVDNMIIYNPTHAFGLFSLFNTDAIKVAEVITGGFGAEYGGRLSSVINIIAKEGNRKTFGGKLNLGLLSGQGMIEGPLPFGSYLFSLRKSFFDESLKKFLKREVPLSFYDFSGKVVWDLSPEGKLSIIGMNSNDQLENAAVSEPDFLWNNNAFGINLQSFVERYLVNLSISYSAFKASKDPKEYEGGTKAESKISNFLFDSKVDIFLGNNDIFSFGFMMYIPRMEYVLKNNAKFVVTGDENLRELSFFSKYKFTQITSLSLEAGVRGTSSGFGDNSNFFFEPRINLKYRIFDFLAFKSSYSLMHQSLVTTSNESDLIPLFEVWIPIKKPFESEKAVQYVAGFDGTISDFINYTIQGFSKKTDNLLGYNMRKASKTDPDFASGSGKASGIELSIKLDFRNVFALLAYSYCKIDQTISGITYPPRYDKKHNLNIMAGMKLPYDINFNLNWEISGGMPYTPILAYYDGLDFPDIDYGNYLYDVGDVSIISGNKNSKRLPAYQKLDVGFSKTFAFFQGTKLNLGLDIINLYNQKNIFYFNPKTGERFNMLPFMISTSVGIEF
jgi:hypothetical protein